DPAPPRARGPLPARARAAERKKRTSSEASGTGANSCAWIAGLVASCDLPLIDRFTLCLVTLLTAVVAHRTRNSAPIWAGLTRDGRLVMCLTKVWGGVSR